MDKLLHPLESARLNKKLYLPLLWITYEQWAQCILPDILPAMHIYDWQALFENVAQFIHKIYIEWKIKYIMITKWLITPPICMYTITDILNYCSYDLRIVCVRVVV